jgi:hypothetical protein
MVHARTAAAFTGLIAAAMLALLAGGAFAGNKATAPPPDWSGRPIRASDVFAQAAAAQHTTR